MYVQTIKGRVRDPKLFLPRLEQSQMDDEVGHRHADMMATEPAFVDLPQPVVT